MTAVAAFAAAPANENSPALPLALRVTDPEVVHELRARSEGTERDAFALHALRVGVLAVRQASGALDAQSIQRESERMLSAAREALEQHATRTTSAIAQVMGAYLDPASGSLPQRIDRLVKRDGELEALLASHLDGDRSTIAQTLARKVGEDSALFKVLSPASADGIVGTLTRTIDEALRVQRDHVLRQFSLDAPESALSRLVADVAGANAKLRSDLAGDVASLTRALSFDDDSGPLSRFVARVEKAQRSVLDQFSLDCEGSAMRRLASSLDDTRATVDKRLTLDDATSPLSRLRRELMDAVAALGESNTRFQSDVRATLEAFRVRREESARSSAHGHTFEYAAGELLDLEARRAGDICERLSGTPGSEGRKVGDYVVTLGPESAAPGERIAIECKADRGYSEAKALAESALARKNRGAQMGVFVLARESAPEGFEPLRRIGPDVLVMWDSADPATDVYLKAAMSIAKALVVQQHRQSDREEAGVRDIEQSIRTLERLVTAVDGVAHSARIVVKRGTSIAKAAAGMRERIEEEVERLRGVVEGIGGGEEGAG